MNTYYETFLRKDIYPYDQEAVDLIWRLYDESPKERQYIIYALEDYIHGESRYKTWFRLQQNVVCKYKHIYKHNAQYLDDEYKEKMKGGN